LYVSGSVETQNCAALLCLPFLIQPSSSGKRKKGGKSWRPSRAEIRDGFITHLQSVAELKETVDRRRDKFASLSLTLQPFVVVVGPTIDAIHSIYVVVEDNFFKVDNVLTAIDTCFKMFFVLHAKYPDECAPVWFIIQKGIYKLNTKWDKVYTSVNSVMSDLGME